MRETIMKTLRRIEETQDVRIIYALESGSRAWGFASPDSDYDVRYIYVRRPEEYVRVAPLRDTIEGPLDEVLDFSGWDVCKALRLLGKTNPSLMEWAGSPIVYVDTPAWQRMKAEIPAYFSVKAEMHHYLSQAWAHWKLIAPTATPKMKKYLYLMRPLMCAQWLERHGTMPPVPFAELMDAMVAEELRPVMEELLSRKRATGEKGLVPRIEALDALYLRESARLTAVADEIPPLRTDADALNRLLREMIALAWAE